MRCLIIIFYYFTITNVNIQVTPSQPLRGHFTKFTNKMLHDSCLVDSNTGNGARFLSHYITNKDVSLCQWLTLEGQVGTTLHHEGLRRDCLHQSTYHNAQQAIHRHQYYNAASGKHAPPCGPLRPNVTSSTKPEVHNVSQRRQRRTEPRPPGICTKQIVKICPAVPEKCSRTDRQTDRNTPLSTGVSE